MSKELKIRDSIIFALCAEAELDSKSVTHIEIRTDCVIFEVVTDPMSVTAEGFATVLVVHPYS